jgi:hypothetical protein
MEGFHAYINYIVGAAWFRYFIMGCILLNAVFLALETNENSTKDYDVLYDVFDSVCEIGNKYDLFNKFNCLQLVMMLNLMGTNCGISDLSFRLCCGIYYQIICQSCAVFQIWLQCI